MTLSILGRRWTKSIFVSASCTCTQFALQWFAQRRHSVHFTNVKCVYAQFLSKQFPLVHTDTPVTMHTTTHTHTYTPHTPFHSPEWLHSLWFNGHFVGCNSILSHPLVPTGEITGSGLIHKTHRTTLESLLQFELSNHNGGDEIAFLCSVRLCVCAGECAHGG